MCKRLEKTHYSKSVLINARGIESDIGEYLDILAVSCDSFNEETNTTIGRQQGKKNHLESLNRVRDWCNKYKVRYRTRNSFSYIFLPACMWHICVHPPQKVLLRARCYEEILRTK